MIIAGLRLFISRVERQYAVTDVLTFRPLFPGEGGRKEAVSQRILCSKEINLNGAHCNILPTPLHQVSLFIPMIYGV